MKIWVVALVALASSSAFAARTIVTCDEGKNSEQQFTAYVNFDPSVVLESRWTGEGGNSILETYKQGKADDGGTTTARVSVGFPSGNRRLVSEFYSVNVFGIQDKEVAPYRMFHGHDKDKQFDLTLALSDSGMDADPKSFQGVLVYAPASTTRVYRQVTLVCSALVRN